jgi:ABC-2 type transport system permease protein
MTAWSEASAPPSRPGAMASMRAVYLLVLRSQASRAKIFGLLAMGAVAVVLGLVIGSGDATLRDATRFVSVYALTLAVPVGSLVIGSAAFGDMIDDGTIVYLWMRPVPRWRHVVAATAASLTIVVPLVVGPVLVAAIATDRGGDLVAGAVASALIGVVAYSGIFVLLGLWVKRALIWGLAYILIWEGFVASAGRTASRLAIRSYTRSIVSHATGIPLKVADVSTFFSYFNPLLVFVVALALASWRMNRQDVA